MVHALLVCSDAECTAVFEAYGPLREVRALACECGCGLEVIGCPEDVSSGDRDDGVELRAIAA